MTGFHIFRFFFFSSSLQSPLVTRRGQWRRLFWRQWTRDCESRTEMQRLPHPPEGAHNLNSINRSVPRTSSQVRVQALKVKFPRDAGVGHVRSRLVGNQQVRMLCYEGSGTGTKWIEHEGRWSGQRPSLDPVSSAGRLPACVSPAPWHCHQII